MKVLTVTELTLAIKRQLESTFSFVTVQGEISNLKLQSSGHIYFTLKDQEAQVSAVLFKGNTKGLSRLPKEGDKVILKGEISVYAPRGNYQLLVREVQYEGVGQLLLKLHELKAKLAQKGCFAPEHKIPLPKFPKKIGVVTSPTGAVIQDILHVLQRRHSGFHLILNPVKVQGEGASEEIAKAIEEFNTHNLVDVIIVGRGGGSLEDLWAFNEEIVVEAVYASHIPIVSAVGHETDFTLCDFAADIRAPTPSAAAEIVMQEKEQQLRFLFQARQRLHQNAAQIVEHANRRVKSVSRHPYLTSSNLLLSKRWQQLDEYKVTLDSSIENRIKETKLQLTSLQKEATALKPTNQIIAWKDKISSISKSLHSSILLELQQKKKKAMASLLFSRYDLVVKTLLHYRKEKLNQLTSHIQTVNPKNLLTKGYCILFSEKKDSVILSSHNLKQDEKLCVLMHDGEVNVKVDLRP